MEDKNDDFVEESIDSFDEITLEDTEATMGDKLKKLKIELKTSQNERSEYLDGWQRSKADLLNMRKRFEEERERDFNRFEAKFIERLLPLCDSFDMALEDAESWKKMDSSWRKGIEQIQSQLQSILDTYRVTKLEALGKTFNPHEHEAVTSEITKQKKEHQKILQVLQHGYKMGDTLIRPARVVVGEFKNTA